MSQSLRERRNIDINTRGAVYLLKCKDCEVKGIIATYLGETGRSLKQRLGEHFCKLKNRMNLTEIGKQDIDVHNSFDKYRWSIEIIEHEEDSFIRKSLEALWIDNLKPTLNISKGLTLAGV